MKQFKRVMAMLLCLVMTLGLFAGLTLPASAADVTETLTASDFAATGTSYASSSGVSKGGTAVYAAYTAKNSSNIQFNKKQNCYIVSTASGGKVKSVKVTIASGSQAIIVKGSNTAYTTANAYSNGTEIARGTSTFTATPTTDYEYFAIVGNANGAVYISSVEVTWTSGGSTTNYTVSYDANTTDSYTGTLPSNATVADGGSHTISSATLSRTGYNFLGWNTSSSASAAQTGSITITGNTVLYAVWQAKTAASITLNRNGTSENVTGYYVGDTYTLPTAGADVNGHKHVGWSSVTIPTPGSKPTTNYYELGATVSSLAATQTFYAVYANEEGSGSQTTASDTLDRSTTGVTGTSYTAWSDKDGSNSDAVYAGQSSGGNSSIQLRAQSPSGIISTTSGGKITKVSVTWNSNTSTGRTLNVYGSNTAYTASSELYSSSTQGTLLGTIVCGTSTELAITDDYEYVGVVSASGAMYLDDITFEWTNGTAASYSGYTTSPQQAAADTYKVTVTQPAQGGSITWTGSLTGLEEGDDVTLTAVPDTGYEIDTWTISTDDYSTSGNNVTITIGDADVTATVTFKKIDYTITKSATGGTITAAATANYGDTVSFTVTPDSGNQIDSVTVTDASSNSVTVSGSNGSYSFTMPASNVTITATCSALPTYSYTIYSNSVQIDSGTAASVTAPAAPASIQYTYEGDSTPTTFTFAGWAVQSSTITDPGAFSGTLYAAGATIPLSANNTVIRAIFASGSGAGFKLSYTYQGTEYFAGAKGSGDYLSASTDATDAVGFGMEQYNNSEYYYLFYTVNGDKYYLTGTTSSTLTISSANTVPNSGYFLWKETESSGTYTFTSYNTSGTAARPLAFNNSTKDRYACYNSANTLTKTSGAEYLTEAGATYYAVTYEENAGSDTVTNMPSNGSVREGNSYTIPSTTPVREGYHFDGWFDNDEGEEYAAGDTISSVNGNITLTAQWSVRPAASVTFYDTDGTTVLQSGNVYVGDTPAFTGTEPTKAASGANYYTFAGWNTSANQTTATTITAITGASDTRTYYPVFTEHTATFTLSFSGRTKVATEGSFQSTVLTPALSTETEGCSATVTGLTINSGSNDSIATVSTTGNVLTVTGVSAGSLTLNVTASFAGGTATGTVTVTVISGSGGAAGGYKLITKDNTGTDVSDYDWTGEYLMVARPNGLAANFNTLEVMQFVWTDDTTATIADSNQNRAEFDLGSATQDEFGVASATNGSVTMSAIHTGESDYVTGAETTADGMIYDRITGFSDGTNDITNKYVLVFERVDEVNNYYTIRVKGTNYYLTSSSTATSGGNTMGGNASPTSIGSTLLWHLRWAGASDSVDGRASNTITLNGESFTPDCILIESVEALNNNVSRAILYNQSGQMFRVYGEVAYANNGPLIGTNGGYNMFLYGKNNPFESEIHYDGTPRNTTDAKIEVPWNYASQAGNSSLLLEGALVPETYPGWTILNSSIPTWNLVGAYNPNGTTFSSATSISAISGTQNANFNVANWTASDIGKYYVVRVNYQVQDPDGVIYDVPQQAMIVVTNSTNTYTTVLHEATSQNNTGSWTVPSRIGSTGVDLDAYVRDNYSTIYTDREEVNGLTASQPTTWTYTSQKGYTYNISSAGVVTWDPNEILQDDVVEIKATAGLSGGGTTATVAEGSYVLYVRLLAYSGEVQATPDSSVTTIPYGDTAFAVTLDNFQNNNGDAPGSSTYSINAASEWTWTAATLNGTTVPVTKTATGATLDVTGLATGTQVIVRATNVIATSNVVANTHTVVTVAGKVFTIGEDNSLAAVNDSFVLDFDRNAVLNVMANDRNADGATLTLGTAPTGVTLTKNADNTVSFTVPGGQLTETYTFTYTLSKSGETDSTATVTVKPATAIYYEDNNSLFTYTDGTQGRWSDEGTASDWTQDADASAIGYDANVSGLTYSLGRVKKANVGKDTSYGTAGSSAKWPTMTFTFVGNAFEIDTFRDADAGMFRVTVDGTKYNVSTAYGATYDDTADEHAAGAGWTYGVAGNYYGMPVFVWGDPSSTATATSHTVTVQVLYTASFDYASPAAGNYDVLIDGVKIYNPNVGGTTYKYISFRDTVIAAGTLGVPTTDAHSYIATLTPANLSVGVGYTGQLSVSLTDNGQTVSNTGYTVSYASDDTNIATVAADGTITGVAEGTATITATITPNGGAAITKTCVVNVTNTVYTVTYKLPNGDQTVTYTDSSISLGSGVTHLTAAELAEYNAHNYVFRGWASAAVADTTTQPATLRDDGASVTLTGDATYYAVYRYGTTDSDFALKTDLSTPLVDGETIVIYETEGSPTNYLLSNADYSSTWNNFRLGVAAAPANGIVTTTNSSLYWEVVATNGGFLLMDEDGNYLTATDTDGQLVMTDTPDAKAIWNATTTGVTGTNSVFLYNSEASPKYLQHYSGYAEFGAYTYDEAWANRNEMQIYVQQANASYYTTDLQSTTVRYNVNYYVNGTAIDSEQIAEGGNPSFPNVTGAYTEAAGYSHDYTFLGWIPATIAEDTTSAPATIYSSGDTYAVNEATSFYAVFRYTSGSGGSTAFVTEASELTEGTYAIVAKRSSGNYFIMTSDLGTASTKRYQASDSGTSDSSAILEYNFADTMKWNVEAGETSGTWYLKSVSANEYATWSTGNSGDLSTTAYALIAADGVVFKSNSDNTRQIVLNSQNDYFAFYTSAQSGAQLVKLGGSSSAYYATTLGEATPITHSYEASITPTSLALHPGETGSVSATLTDNGTAVAGATPTYTTSLSSVATVAADGTVTAVANGNATITATYTVGGTDYTATCDVAVTTLATYNVTYMVNGSQYGETESVVQGNSPSFTAPSYDVSSYNAHAYEFLGWKEGSALSADTTETQTLYVAGNSHVISANTTYYAVYRYVEGGSVTTAVEDLSNGAHADYVIAANVSGTYYAMSNSTFSGKLTGTQITTPGSSISASDATGYVVTIAKSADGYTISNGTNLLGWSSGTDFATSANTYWSITTGSHGSYRVTNVGSTSTSTTRGLTYRTGTVNKFAPYATNNINGTEYYDVEIIPVGGGSGTTYYATTLNVAAAHNYVASISPSSVTIEEGEDTYTIGTLTDNGITTTAYTPTYSSSDSSVVLVDENTGYVLAAGVGTATVTVSYNVDGTTYSAVCNVTVTAATVVNSYTVTYKVNGNLYDTESVAENGNPSFIAPSTDISAYDAHSYSFVGWAASTVSDTTTAPTTYTASNASSYTVTGDVTFHAVYTWSEGGSGSGSGTAGWTLVTDASTLKSGDKLVLAESSKGFTAGDISSSVMSNITSTFSSDKSSITSLGSNTVELTLGGSSGAWTFSNGTSLLGATAVKKLAWGSGTTTWSISIASDGAATIENGTSSYGKFLYNVSSPRFTTYTSSASSSMILPQLYRYSAGSTGGDDGTNYYTTTLEAQGTDPVLTVSPTSLSMSEGGYAEISVTAANGGANAYVTATSSATGVANVYALNDGNNTYGVTAGSAGSATITIKYYDSSNTQLASQTVSVTVSAAGSGSTGATDDNFGRVGSEGNAPTTSGSTNKGTRGVVATSISNQAKSYYETNNVNFNTWNNLAGVNSTNSAEAATGNSLRTSLGNLMKSTLTTTVSYSSLTGYWATTDRSNNASNANLFYSCVTSSSYNREHVWPKSKGQFYESGAGSDLHHLRPSDANVNSSRGNLIMADVNPEMTSSPSTYSYSGNVVLWKTGNYVEPLDQVKGDVARIFMYVYTTYPENTNLFTDTSGGGSGNNASNGERAIYDRATLLKWCKMDPVDTWEMSRNDACESIQHNRNVYIDYPELVWMVFGLNPPTDMATPSGKAAAGVTGRATDTTNYGTSAVTPTASVMSSEPVVETATRSVNGSTQKTTVGDTASDLPVTGAVMVDAKGEISNNDDVVSYLANYGAKNCLIVPAGGAVVFYLNNGADGTEVAIGANAINGTGTTLKVYQINAVTESAATGTVLLEQAIASSTEMYYKIDGITWTGDKTNVLMVRNEGSAPMIITNLRATGNPDAQISTRAIHQGIDVSNLEMVIDNETVLAAIAAMNALNDGTFGDNDTPAVPVETPVAVLTNASLSLEGLIGVNFYVTVPSTLKNSGYYFTINGEKAQLEKVPGASTAYRVTGRVAAKEMNDLLELKLYDKNGNEQTFGVGSKNDMMAGYSYSVRQYLEYVEEHSDDFDAKVLALCSAMSDYGIYAQTFFKYQTDTAAYIQNADAIAAVTIGADEYTYTYTDDTANIRYYGESVITESETAIRFYFTLGGDVNDYTVTVNGAAGEFVKAGKYYYVEVSNIAAKDLGKGNTVTVTYGEETLTIDGYSVYTYVKKQLTSSDADLVNAVKALKYYGDAAANYFKEEN